MRVMNTSSSPFKPSAHAESHDLGLPFDLQRLAEQTAARRRALGWLAGAAAWSLAGCGGGSSSDGGTTTGTVGGTGTSTGTSGTTTCTLMPEETAGPYPGDGSNSTSAGVANALALTGIVRSDIRSSINGATGVAAGVRLTVKLRLLNTSNGCGLLSGYAIYLWHCDAQGRYSMYSAGVTAENYLRGVQATGSDGIASFTTVFPGCYSGRMPHMHFEVYRSTSTATAFSNKLRTSQLALPTAACSEVYATGGEYAASVRNLAAISFASDNVFSDGVSTQLATVTGNVTDGYVATLDVAVPV